MWRSRPTPIFPITAARPADDSGRDPAVRCRRHVLALIDSIETRSSVPARRTASRPRYLARPDSHVATIAAARCAQGQVQLEALRQRPHIRRRLCGRQRSGRGRSLPRRSQRLGSTPRCPPRLREATLQSDVIVACTTGRTRPISDMRLPPDTFIAARADNPEKSEIILP